MQINREGSLDMKYGARLYKRVRVVLARPLYGKDGFASVLSEKGDELGMIDQLSAMPTASQQALEYAKKRHYLIPRITKIRSLASQFGAVYWNTDTDRGPREFVIRGISEHVRWLDDKRLLITDVDGNRFEIKDLEILDRKSKALIDIVI